MTEARALGEHPRADRGVRGLPVLEQDDRALAVARRWHDDIFDEVDRHGLGEVPPLPVFTVAHAFGWWREIHWRQRSSRSRPSLRRSLAGSAGSPTNRCLTLWRRSIKGPGEVVHPRGQTAD
ncbi:MAG TPA: hypothetical protein VHG53_05745 [Candidatus Limnocylindria bacterium]|nr:hypothetical protein [Candidatus Limnocylindria bacterium]